MLNFLGRAKRYGKWKEYTIEKPNGLDNWQIREYCVEHVKQDLNSEYAEITQLKTI